MLLWLEFRLRGCLLARRLRHFGTIVRAFRCNCSGHRLLGIVLALPHRLIRGGGRSVPQRLLLLPRGVTRRFAKSLPRNLCSYPPGLAAYSDAYHHRGDHEGEGEGHHDHTHLYKKRVSFSEHPPAFQWRVLPPAHVKQPYPRPADEQRQQSDHRNEEGEATGVW